MKAYLDNKLSVTFFYIAYTLAVFYWMFDKVTFCYGFLKYIIYIVYGILLFCCLVQAKKYNPKELFYIIFLAIIIIISKIQSDNSNLLSLLLFVLAMKNIEVKKLIDYDWKLKLVFLIIIIILYYLGFTENFYAVRDDGTIRSAMGFSHPNKFGTIVSAICFEYVYLKYPNINIFTYIKLLFAMAIIYFLSDSRTSVITILFVMISLFILRKMNNEKNKTNILKKAAIISLVASIALSIYLSLNYTPSNELMHKINYMLSGRLSYAHRFMIKYPVNLFGNLLDFGEQIKYHDFYVNQLILDNAYVRMLLQFGLVPFIVFCLGIIKTIKQHSKNENYIYILFILVFILKGLMENILFLLYGNIFLLYFSKIIYNRDETARQNT